MIEKLRIEVVFIVTSSQRESLKITAAGNSELKESQSRGSKQYQRPNTQPETFTANS
jgi:hypothetical protein